MHCGYDEEIERGAVKVMRDGEREVERKMTPEGKEWIRKLQMAEEQQKLLNEVFELYSELSVEMNDAIIANYFDADSTKNLKKKKRILQGLVDGRSHEDFGMDFIAILEKLPSDFMDGEYDLNVAGWNLRLRDFQK